MHEEKECNVDKGAEEVPRRSELAPTTNDLEHFRFDLPLEGCIKLVPKINWRRQSEREVW